MKYAHIIDKNLKGWYTSEIHSEIPTPNIEVTEEEWQEALRINANYYDGKVFSYKAPILTTEEIIKKEALELKSAKELALNSITVTTKNGNTFDGNETARGNMTSAILSAEVIGKTEDTWKLADNTSAVITISELKEALALSIQEVGRIVMITSKEEL